MLTSILYLWLCLSWSFGCSAAAAFAAAASENTNNIRLNKVFRETHSRRQADQLIAEGRVKINGNTVHDMGRRVVPYQDVVELDERPYTGWELRHGFILTATTTTAPVSQEASASVVSASVVQQAVSSDTILGGSVPVVQEEYIKYWKPVGVTSTTDRTVPGNLIDSLLLRTARTKNHPEQDDDDDRHPISQRIFSVGRLDKDSSGLLLLTSDGRVPNAVLRKQCKRPKTYHVTVDRPVKQQHVERLRAGMVITTDTVRQGKHRQFTAPTLPCQVVPLLLSRNDDNNYTTLQMTLTEGRNRQIRVMLKTVGDYTVTHLHRTNFMGIDLTGLSGPGDWMRLNESERQILDAAIVQAAAMEINPQQQQAQQ